MRKFTVTEEHIKLLRATYTGWNDCEFGAPSIDCKRPYGSKNVHGDMAKILGIKALDEEGYDFEEKDMKRMDKLHEELRTVLQIVLKNLEFKPGVYETI